MTFREPAQHAPKTLGESAVCFGFTLAALAAAAVALQWLIGLVG